MGKRFGRLTVLRRCGTYSDPYGESKRPIWWCRCDCGMEIEVLSTNLMNGGTKSCGCLRSETARKTATVGALAKGREKYMEELRKKREDKRRSPSAGHDSD